MRGRDPETNEFYSPSRSQQRREAIAILTLAKQLMDTVPAKLLEMAMPEELTELVLRSQRISSHIARKRQTQFLAKALRRESDELIAQISAAFAENKEQVRREATQLHQIELSRETLIAGGDIALEEYISKYPEVDRQQLRQLIRNVHNERKANKPPRAYRELFQLLKAIMLSAKHIDSDSDAGSEVDEDD